MSNEIAAQSIDMNHLAILGVVFIVIAFIVFSGGSKSDSASAAEKFLIPKKGGALQLEKKDEDGNVNFELAKKIKVSDDTYIFRFKFPNENMVLGLPIGMHVLFSAMIKSKEFPEGDEVQRKYTPISMVTQKGYVDFLIKVYYANVHPRFPEGGLMSQHMDKMQIGDKMLMAGPKGRLFYYGHGKFEIARKIIEGKKKIGCISGGTGITPCYQVIQSALKNDDGTKLSLIFGNRTTNDILLKDELMAMKEVYPEKFNLYLTVDVTPDEKENWKQGTGFMTIDMLRDNLPEPSKDTLILYCGPPPFEAMVKKNLKELGYDDTMQFKF